MIVEHGWPVVLVFETQYEIIKFTVVWQSLGQARAYWCDSLLFF